MGRIHLLLFSDARLLFFNEAINENSETGKLGYCNGALGALHREATRQ